MFYSGRHLLVLTSIFRWLYLVKIQIYSKSSPIKRLLPLSRVHCNEFDTVNRIGCSIHFVNKVITVFFTCSAEIYKKLRF